MARDRSAGIILYPEDIDRIRRSVKPQYQFAVIFALSRYAATGELPTEAELGEGGMVAFEFVRDKIDAALESYRTNSEKRRAAASARWDANGCKPAQTEEADANGCKRMQTDAYASKTETETETVTGTGTETEMEDGAREWRPQPTDTVTGIDGQDLSEDIRRNETADAMIRRYNLPRDLPTREKLIADLAAHGEDTMRRVLEKACESNTRERVTAAYWRAILQNDGKGKPARASPALQGYVTGADHRDEAYFKALEVDLDEEDDLIRHPPEAGATFCSWLCAAGAEGRPGRRRVSGAEPPTSPKGEGPRGEGLREVTP